MKGQAGFSLIEVAVALLLVSLGALGMLRLQGMAIASTTSAGQRTAAAMLAAELLELMRANPSTTFDSAGHLNATSGYWKAKGSLFPSAPSTCRPIPASASEQLGCWAKGIATQLPADEQLRRNEFYVCRSSSAGTCSNNGSAIEIQIAWRARPGECAAAEVCRYQLRSEL